MTAYLCLGSNLGDALNFVEKGIGMIADAFPECEITRTPVIVSEPWGYASAHPYINLTVRLTLPLPTTEAHAIDLLNALQGIEQEISTVPHRNADGTYRDREIDIDIIAIDGLRMHHPRLVLPHPRASQRPFVTIPMHRLSASHLLEEMTETS